MSKFIFKNCGKKISKSFLVLLEVGLLLFSTEIMAVSSRAESSDQILKDSIRAYQLKDHNKTLKLLKKYFDILSKQPSKKAKSLFRFYAVSTIGRIYLQQENGPGEAILWFQKIEKTDLLSDAEMDIVDSWIAGIKDWIKLGQFPNKISNPNVLFDLGKKYYEIATKTQKYPADPIGEPDLSIASSYLVPFLVHNDKDPRIGEALFMMGDIRRRQWDNTDNWSENYYLTEAIRRFPGTPLASKAYQALEEDVHFGYTGTSGDHTPDSWIELLREFKDLANTPLNSTDLGKKK